MAPKTSKGVVVYLCTWQVKRVAGPAYF